MRLSIIACIGENRAIGFENKLLWHLPDDLKHFRELTLENTVIMGMNTYKSIGKPLARRENIVLTRQKDIELTGCKIVNSIEQALEVVHNRTEVFIIGGESIYKQFLPKVSRLNLTLVKNSPFADAFFPEYENDFYLKEVRHHLVDINHEFEFSFRKYEMLLKIQ